MSFYFTKIQLFFRTKNKFFASYNPISQFFYRFASLFQKKSVNLRSEKTDFQ